MIQEYLMNQAKTVAPDLEWTVDYYSSVTNSGTVNYEGGPPSDVNNDADTRYPQYMFYIRTADWSKAEVITHKLYKLFHKKKVDELIYVPELETSYRVFFIKAMSEPVKIGVIDDTMEYSLNIQATIEEEL